jgi:hypothetical protein
MVGYSRLTDPARDVHDDQNVTWAISGVKTVFAAPITVDTIDQAMLSVLRVRHSWLRASWVWRCLAEGFEPASRLTATATSAGISESGPLETVGRAGVVGRLAEDKLHEI